MDMEHKVASVDSLIIYFGDKIDKKINQKVRDSFFALKEAKLDEILDLIPSYTSILIKFDIFKFTHKELLSKVEHILNSNKKLNISSYSKVVKIPVYYDLSVGFDLERVARINNLTIKDVIKYHTSKEYLVYAIGFAPGFAYMAEVDNKISTPRLATPRAKVPKGSVGIANNQTAVYPKDSPGGWNIIGKCPIEMFSKEYNNFSYLSVGDRVVFEPISKDEFLRLGGKI